MLEKTIKEYIRKRWAYGPEHAYAWLLSTLQGWPYRDLRAAGKAKLFPEKKRSGWRRIFRGI